jgi:UDP-N-acetylmuramoyl-tripeptide--D-alanyl-D-alanine ligase
MLMDRENITAWLGNPPMTGKGEGRVESVVIDSRKAGKNSLFVPLSGERTDGHNFIEAALEQGASVIPVSSEWARANGRLIETWNSKVCFPVVENTLQALQDLAMGFRNQFDNLTVIGITGSNGKTTTKEILFSILSRSGAAICNEGNLNSDSGLPLSVFRITSGHRYAVLEMGMNRVGEMASLARIARPDFALVTNVGTAHIGMIGSKQGIAQEKKAIFSQFTGKETAFLNNDDPYSDFLAEGVKGRIVKYGPGVSEGYEFIREEGISGQVIRLFDRDVPFPLPGAFNVSNALGAVAVASELGFSQNDIAWGIENCSAQFGRTETVQGKTITLFRDCYNANGDSMIASLDLVSHVEKGRRKIAVLADMAELGEEALEFHKQVIENALKHDFAGIFLLGKLFTQAFNEDSLLNREKTERVESFLDIEKMKTRLIDFVSKGDLILLKGSRVMALERLSEPLLAL